MAQFCDRLTIDRKHRSSDGYLRVHAKAARSGIQDYLGAEVDPEGKHFAADQVVKVYRPAAEVFDKASMASFIGKPITDDHPSEAVTSANWRDHSRGVIGGAAKDGEWLGFDLALMDAATIAKVDAGKCELSGGYSCDLSIEAGTTPAGDAYQAVQRNIRGNHLAVVDRARAGSDARIVDGGNIRFAACDTTPNILNLLEDREPAKMPHTMIIDGLQVPNVSDEAKAAIEKLQGQVTDERSARAADKTAHDKALAAKDTEIDTLKGKVVDQAQIDNLADAKSAVVADARKIAGGKLGDTAGRTVADVRRMALAATGIDIADKSDDYVEARFDGLKDAMTADGATVQNINPGKAITDGAAVRDLARAAQY